MTRGPGKLPIALFLLAAATVSRAQETGAGRETSLASQAQSAVGPPGGLPLSGPALETATNAVAAELRCPVCQGLSVADSPTELARNMKRQARELLAAGYDKEQVLGYFESSYGEFVRLEPPLRGINWLVWLAPLIGLLAGGFVVARSLRRLKKDAAPAGLEPDDVEDPGLEPYLQRVREMAYGPAAGPSDSASAPPASTAGRGKG